jgi:hypothetical protein
LSAPIQVTQPTHSPINETPRKPKHRSDRTLKKGDARCRLIGEDAWVSGQEN